MGRLGAHFSWYLDSALCRYVLVEGIRGYLASPAGRAVVVGRGQRDRAGHRAGVLVDDGDDAIGYGYRRHVLAFDVGRDGQAGGRVIGGIRAVGSIRLSDSRLGGGDEAQTFGDLR